MSETPPESPPDSASETAAEPSTRVVLLTHGQTLPRWAHEAVQRMVAETDAEITLVVEDGSDDDGRSALEALERLVELREWGLIAAARELFADEPAQLDRMPISEIDGVPAADHVAVEPETVDGWKHALPDHAVERVAEADVGLRFGFGFLVGDALTAPEQGVLSFHHGDFREYRGQPAGFWEYVHGRETAGVTLQRINETLDGGEVVVSRGVEIGDAPTWKSVRCRLYDASAGMLAEGIRRLERESFEPETLASDEMGEVYTHPRGRPVLTYLRKTAHAELRKY